MENSLSTYVQLKDEQQQTHVNRSTKNKDHLKDFTPKNGYRLWPEYPPGRTCELRRQAGSLENLGKVTWCPRITHKSSRECLDRKWGNPIFKTISLNNGLSELLLSGKTRKAGALSQGLIGTAKFCWKKQWLWDTHSPNYIQATEGNLLMNWSQMEGVKNDCLFEVKGQNYPR